ncbi:MAG: phosphoribosylglycinamide formyltransferase [Candidatus Micrarchaeota archaeon]|nr:phosphoribosylglycinamide formyltransferase [Candidatus Micrarchaeota archaeon]
MTIRVAVLASGRGSDFQSIIDGIGKGEVDAEIVGLITDNPEAKAIERAKKNKIPVFVVERKNFAAREEHDKAIGKKLDELRVGLVVLAGYMRLVKDAALLTAYKGKMINIHPSLLPAFPGAHAQKDAFDYGAKISGYTIHFVDESLDGGPVILQEAVDISGCKTADEVSEAILRKEHVGLPKIVDSFSKGKYSIEGRRVKYAGK